MKNALPTFSVKSQSRNIAKLCHQIRKQTDDQCLRIKSLCLRQGAQTKTLHKQLSLSPLVTCLAALVSCWEQGIQGCCCLLISICLFRAEAQLNKHMALTACYTNTSSIFVACVWTSEMHAVHLTMPQCRKTCCHQLCITCCQTSKWQPSPAAHSSTPCYAGQSIFKRAQ